MTSIAFIADFFVEDVSGGGELNNEECISLLRHRGYQIKKIHSKEVFYEDLMNFDFYIIGNFIMLSEKNKQTLQDSKIKYIIYEHDHKYLKSRIPSMYPNFKAPENQIINKPFYENALAVLCQSQFHKDIVFKNLKINNIVSLGGNLWDDKTLKYIEFLNNKFPLDTKKQLYSIAGSSTQHKNTKGAVDYCEKNNIKYSIIFPCAYNAFLKSLAVNKGFVFFPQTPETLSRVVVEAKMLNVDVITNDLIGAKYETWFDLTGNDLVETMKQKKIEIIDKICEFC